MAEEIAAEAVKDVSPSVESIGIVGNPSDKVVEYTDQNDAFYIIIVGRKHSPVGKALFGSVTQSILLNAFKPLSL